MSKKQRKMVGTEALGSRVSEMDRQQIQATIREMIRGYQAYTAFTARNVRDNDLTTPQFEVICTLGENEDGLTFKELGEQALITKGTLTGVIDRLEQKGLVKRVMSASDRRSTVAMLTPKGKSMYQRMFPTHLKLLKQTFSNLSKNQIDALRSSLNELTNALG